MYDRAKDYLKDRHKDKCLFETGKLLSEAGKEYVNNEKLNPLGSKLSWSHYSELLIYI